MTTSIPTTNQLNAMSATQYKTYENRLRRAADRQGYMLVKSRRRDPHAIGYGKYVLVEDKKGNRIGRHGGQAAISELDGGFGDTLDGIDQELRGLARRGVAATAGDRGGQRAVAATS